MSTKKKLLEAAAGNAGEAIYVDDVFSTDLYTGTGSAETVTNNIDLSGEGGMVWLKQRTNAGSYFNHQITDTVRGKTYHLSTNNSDAEGALSVLSSFNSDGYTAGSSISNNNTPIVGWTFRKQPGFFDVVTYTGNGTNQTISHNLGSVPGMIIVKRRDSSTNAGWVTYHRSTSGSPQNDYMVLQTTQGVNTWTDWNQTAPTSTEFSVGSVYTNTSGASYVAYLFAHDAQDFGTNSDESIIKCGTYTGNGSATGVEVNLGFEPQWLLVKTASGSGIHKNWWLLDNMRGIPADASEALLSANLSDSETTGADICDLTPSGFIPKNSSQANQNGMNYIYVAIRRPHKPASKFAATNLFSVQTYLGNGGTSTTAVIPSFSNRSIDLAFFKQRTQTRNWEVITRLISRYATRTNVAAQEALGLNFNNSTSQHTIYSFGTKNNRDISVNQDGASNLNLNSYGYVAYAFSRAPGFFDVATYRGTGSNLTVPHNLGVAPELLIVKSRTANDGWMVYNPSLTSGYSLNLPSSSPETLYSGAWQTTTVDSTNFYVGTSVLTNRSLGDFVAYMFATVPGISKVGTYSGTGAAQNINCGFTSGAKFVLIKSYGQNRAGDWYLWDAGQGISSSNEGYFLLNSSAAQISGTDYIDPLSSGFTITSSAPVALNASDGEYLFLAIA